MTSMTPFGQTGPYAHYKVTDMISVAMGGMQYICGDGDRSPVRVSFPQAELNAGAQGAVGTMTAFWNRQMMGVGQHVDVSAQVAVVWTLMNATPFPPLHKSNVERAGAFRGRGDLTVRAVFPCLDGHVSFLLGGKSIAQIAEWMAEEGIAPDDMSARDWDDWNITRDPDPSQEDIDLFMRVQRHIEEFLAAKTKDELYQRAISHRILLAPCNTVKDIVESPQLRHREFWVDVYYPHLNSTVPSLGPFIKMSETPIRTRRPAPQIGEHNDEVYRGELGISESDLADLMESGVV